MKDIGRNGRWMGFGMLIGGLTARVGFLIVIGAASFLGHLALETYADVRSKRNKGDK